MTPLLLFIPAIVTIQNSSVDKVVSTPVNAQAAQIEAPPSISKLVLIRRFLVAIGRQKQLDSATILEGYAIPGGLMWPVQTGSFTDDLSGGFEKRMSALKKAYEKHRSEYQRAYEAHVNWEFTEAELAQIVEFLERPVGQHYLEGRWRMEAYVDTETEELDQQIVEEAQASLANE